MKFIKVSNELFINMGHVHSIAETGGAYILYYRDHNNQPKQKEVMKETAEGQAVGKLLQTPD